MADAKDLVEERQATHGEAWALAGEVIRILGASKLLASRSWMFASYVVIVMKLARISSGSPDVIDHWEDIEGYAHLISSRLRKEAELAKTYAIKEGKEK